jgi:hypothetical protein
LSNLGKGGGEDEGGSRKCKEVRVGHEEERVGSRGGKTEVATRTTDERDGDVERFEREIEEGSSDN